MGAGSQPLLLEGRYRLIFTLALDSFRGTFGFASNGRLAATSGISRLLWGMGTWNHHSAGVVALACSEHYEVPAIVQAVALDHPNELWLKQNQAGVDKVTYKTPYGMLGTTRIMWQATLGPDAIVSGQDVAQVIQWKDTLVAWGGDIYFPAYAFDECVLRDGWVFARRENACVALWAAGQVEWAAPEKRRLHSDANARLCQIVLKTISGSFRKRLSRAMCGSVMTMCAGHFEWVTA